jgi:tetratricopeptide (TPR) repeat protein
MNQSPLPESPEFREAMDSVQLALKLKPEMTGAGDLLTDMYMHTDQYDLAIEQLRLALHDSPSDEAAAFHLLISLRHACQANTEESKSLVKPKFDRSFLSRIMRWDIRLNRPPSIW